MSAICLSVGTRVLLPTINTKRLSLLRYEFKYDLDDPRTTLAHLEIIKSKPFLKRLYIRWYSILYERTRNLPGGRYLEIGSGGGFLKDIHPEFITSDIMPLPHCDVVLSAEKLPYADNELAAIVMVNVLHHIPNPEKFIAEAQRTLVAGGKIVMIEPANTPVSRLIYRNFHHEPFEPGAPGWKLEAGGPLSNANGANPWIIFERDRELFEKEFPKLSIKNIQYHTPFAYLVSGGLTLKSVVPGWAFGFVRGLEQVVPGRLFGMFSTIEIEKKA